jgi:hypothetical protein
VGFIRNTTSSTGLRCRALLDIIGNKVSVRF